MCHRNGFFILSNFLPNFTYYGLNYYFPLLQKLQIGVWFNVGYCAMQQQEYSDAVSAYHRCVSYEPEHFEVSIIQREVINNRPSKRYCIRYRFISKCYTFQVN